MMANKEPIWFLGKIGDAQIVVADTTDKQLEHLNRIGIKAKFVKSNFEVNKFLETSISPKVLAKTVAEEAVRDVAVQLMKKNEKYDIIMGMHTVTVLDNKVVSKTLNPEEALMILKKFNDREHSVFTGLALLPRKKKMKTFYAETKVKFANIPDEMFKKYLKTDEWRNCNAVYDIFGKGAAFVESTNGCFNNFIGFPVYDLVKALEKLLDGNNIKINSSVEEKEEYVPVQKNEHEKTEIMVSEKKEEEAVATEQKRMDNTVEKEMFKNYIQLEEAAAAADQENNRMHNIEHRNEEPAKAPKNNDLISDPAWEDQRFVAATANRGYISATTLSPTRGSSSDRFMVFENSSASRYQNGNQTTRGNAPNRYNSRENYSSGYQGRDSVINRGRSAPREDFYSAPKRYESGGQMNRGTSSNRYMTREEYLIPRSRYESGYEMRNNDRGNRYNVGIRPTTNFCTLINLQNMIEEGYHPTAYVLPVAESVNAMKRFAKLRKDKPKEFEAFDAAIYAFANEKGNSQSHKTLKAKIKVYQKIKAVLPKVKGSTLHFCGSSVNSCGTESCDVDLCWAVPVLTEPTCESDVRYPMFDQGRFYPEILLRQALTEIDELEGVTNTDLINARVRIVKFDIEQDGMIFPCDININNIAGVYNTFMIKHYTKIDERFSILSRVLKAWGKKADVIDSSNGYLNSYTMVLMVLHFLQCGISPPILPNLNALRPDLFDGNLNLVDLEKSYDLDLNIKMERNDTPIGDLLIGFFRYYAMFNYEYDGIVLRMGCVSLKSNFNDMFFLEEVYDRYTVPKNLNHHRLDYIKCTFLDTFLTLTRGPDFKKLMADERTFMKRN